MDARLGYSNSYSWRSIWSSKPLLKEGLHWMRIRNGANVDIWEDSWLADEEGCKVTSPRVEGLSKVSELIDFEKMKWNV